MKKTLIALFTITCAAINAQSIAPDVLASSGNYFVGSNFTNSYTVGQGCLTQTFTGSNFILTQGFQQPYDIPTAVAEQNYNQSIGTYPNPSSGSFDLQYDLTSNAIVTVEVYDVVGRVVHTERSERTAGHQVHSIDLSDQPNGVYFIRCTIDGNGTTNTLTQKITISR